MIETVEKDLTFFEKLKNAFPANRIALVLHGFVVFLTALGIFIASVSGSFPAKWQATAAAIGGIITVMIAGTWGVIKFLDGSQKFDVVQASKEVDLATLTHNSLVSSNLTDDVDYPPESAMTPDIPQSEITGVTSSDSVSISDPATTHIPDTPPQ